MRRISKERIQNLYGPVPDTLFEKADRLFASLPEEKEEKNMKRKIPFTVALAAVLAIVSITAFALGGGNLFRNIETRLNPIVPLHGAQEMIETNLGSSENEYVSVSVEEAIYDGSGVMVLVRVTPKDSAKYALYNEMLQNFDEDLYVTDSLPVPVPEGSQSFVMGGRNIDIVNENGVCSINVDGADTEIPDSNEEAIQNKLPVYEIDTTVYYADFFEPVVVGRKDGKKILDYWVSVIFENAQMMINSREAYLQEDGSVLVWYDGFGFQGEKAPETLSVKVSAWVGEDDQRYTLSEIPFKLHPCEPEREIHLVCKGESDFNEIDLLSSKIVFTKVRAYFTAEYDCENADISPVFDLYTVNNGKKAEKAVSGSGYVTKSEEAERRYLITTEFQSFEEIPDEFILEISDHSTGKIIGSTVFKTEEK